MNPEADMTVWNQLAMGAFFILLFVGPYYVTKIVNYFKEGRNDTEKQVFVQHV